MMTFKKIYLISLILLAAVLPARAAEHFDVVYKIKNVQKVEVGYQAVLNITIFNHTAQAYQSIILVPENIHLVVSDSEDNQMSVNMLPAANFIRHNWTIQTALPLDNIENGTLYFQMTAIDSLGRKVSFPIRAVRENH